MNIIQLAKELLDCVIIDDGVEKPIQVVSIPQLQIVLKK